MGRGRAPNGIGHLMILSLPYSGSRNCCYMLVWKFPCNTYWMHLYWYGYCSDDCFYIASRISNIQQGSWYSFALIQKQCPADRVGQSREILEILFEFCSTFVTALAISGAYPTSELATCGGHVIDPKHQIIYLAHMTRCRRCSKMWLSGADPVWY